MTIQEKDKNMLTRKLTIEEKKELLMQLFDYEIINVNEGEGEERWVIYDSEGELFYSNNENLQFKFNTLNDFFKYHAHIHKYYGYTDCQFKLRKLIGV